MRIGLASHKSLEQVRAFLGGLGADGSEPLPPSLWAARGFQPGRGSLG